MVAWRPCYYGTLMIALGLGLPLLAQPADNLDEALEKATKAAVQKVAPSLVQIRTIGGLELVGGGQEPEVLKGQGPTTGVVVSSDGFIISSSFNFAHKPTTITVSLPDGRPPIIAKVIAHDHTRMLTLLKIDATGLPVPAVAPKSEMKIGQWSLAVGKAWSETGSGPPSVSVGIVSALNRIWGKAIQTDAKVSPVNYGGALVDMQGRVMGVLVPLSPRAEGETAGVDWYDGGIGFAIPLEDINRVLPQLKQGKDLKRGRLGIDPANRQNQFAPAVVARVAPGTPAAKAGIQLGDQIVEIDGKKIERQNQLLHALYNKYEDDKISLKVKRGDKVIELPDIVLSGEAVSFLHAFLGVLPMRDDPEPGVEVRHVYVKSPADTAGLKAGDRILKIDTQTIGSRDQLLMVLSGLAPNVQVKLEVKRKGVEKPETLTAKLGELPETIPAELPPGTHKKALTPKKPMPGPMGLPPKPMPRPKPMPEEKKAEKKDAQKGHYTKKDPTTGREYWVYVPEDYDPNISYAFVLWLHPAGNAMEKDIPDLWKDACKKHHIILMGPKAENPTGWLTSEVDFIKADLRDVLGQYTIDRQRVVVHGLANGGNLALYLAFDAPDLVRGVASVAGAIPGPLRDSASLQRVTFLMYAGTLDPNVEAIRGTRSKLAERKLPVILRELKDHGNGYLNPEGVQEVVRWIDSLDRL